MKTSSTFPSVPDLYGWLYLDRRGRWHLPDGPVRHAGMRAFLDNHYRREEDGRMVVQNGPQRAFVRLESAPYAAWPEDDGMRLRPGGRRIQPERFLCDEEGDVYISAGKILARVDDRALIRLLADLREENGCPTITFAGRDFPLESVTAAELPERFGFVRDPEPKR